MDTEFGFPKEIRKKCESFCLSNARGELISSPQLRLSKN